MTTTNTTLGSSTALTIETIEDEPSFVRLAPEWTELLADSDADCLFLTWPWMFTWWRHLASGCRLHILVVRRDHQVLAILPLVFRYASFHELPPVPALQFLGSGVVGSDYLDVIARRGQEPEVLVALAERLQQTGTTLAWMRMQRSSTAAALVEQMRQRGFRVWQGPEELCPFASMRDLTFDTYLASLGAEHRYAFRRKLGRIQRNPSSRFTLARTEAERSESLSALFTLHDLRWHAQGDAGAFSTPALRSFHEELTRRALAAGWLRLWVLHLDGKPAAALYGFLYRRKFYFYQSGFDPAFARESAGLVLLGVAVRGAMAEGIDELDLLHGTEHYKEHWARERRELLRFELYAPGTRGFLQREATALVRQARRATRVVLDRGRRAVSKKGPVHHAEPR